MFIALDKDWYHPGETVHGAVFFELFRLGFQTKLALRFEGVELFPTRLRESLRVEEEEDGDG